jgi:hypothetical protein
MNSEGLSPVSDKTKLLLAQSNERGIEFCISDLELALAMLDRAATSRDPRTVDRNRDNGCHALRVVQGLLSQLSLNESQQRRIAGPLIELRARLDDP